MTDQLNAAQSALAESDALILPDTDTDPTAAAAAAVPTVAPIHRITSPGQLRPADLDVPTITVIDADRSASTPLIDILSGLGPLSVVHRQTESRTARTPLSVRHLRTRWSSSKSERQ
ncbi:hypothetical protein ACQB60_35230 [Actinomycetota bacterium Odt1-20B]